MKRFGLAGCKTVGTPADISAQIATKVFLVVDSAEAVSKKVDDCRVIEGSLLSKQEKA